MGSIRVTNKLDDLARDMKGIATTGRAAMVPVVARYGEMGNNAARRFARQRSGPHGANYYKRITAEARTPLSWEYGPEGDVVENAVGAGWRNGPANTDLERSMDYVGPKFADAVGKTADRLFTRRGWA